MGSGQKGWAGPLCQIVSRTLDLWQNPLPSVVLDAMACRVPVVATRVGGTPEMVVDGETAVLVDPEHADAIAKSCLTFLNHYELGKNLGNARRKRVEDLFDQKRMVRETIELYQEII